MANERDRKQRESEPEATSATDLDVLLDELIPDEPEDPVIKAYARTGRADTTGISGIPASDEAAGKQRRELYKKGATLVSRID